ncbi:hypothetical protein C5167_035281 [Papaver somniferum]|uniref:Bms1-type G domain-containing protein n=1 Tax=Papaver somniferum TaxID=3469 RepID=A0A4Y7KGY1_PAPSO|nr:hypothetical protein C5167_035281 [Papaver somniferum]
MSIASTSTTSSSLADPAFKIYRRYKYKCEGDCDWGDEEDIFRNKIMYLGNVDESSPPPPPFVVLVQGPPNVGKSLLIKSLVKYFDPMKDITNGPNIIITADKKRRLQLVECLDDIDAMIDAAKYADLVLLLVDANYGFEAETFEFLNLLQAHGLPKVMGVLTHLDQLKDYTKLNETEERLQDLFRTEIYQGAITYNISGLQDDLEANCGRNISLYGYLRGCDIKSGAKVHIAGLDDFHLAGVRSTIDPFPLSEENNFVMLTPMENETFRTGTYLRLEVHDVPFRMVANFYSCHPILVGGISPEDKDVGYMQAMLKRHNWHMKLLMSAEPVTMSAGWRRYGTKPIYARQIDNARHQIRDFIPEREHCLAMFWGPLAPAHTRITVVHKTKEVFRIAAKAVVLDPKHHFKIMKDSKRKGKPEKILKDRRSALIKFEPEDFEDVAAFKGASIRTDSGIWGKVIKKDPAQRRLELEQRRRVEITDDEPYSYPFSTTFTLILNIEYLCNKGKKTVVVMSEEKRKELVKKQQDEEESKKLSLFLAEDDMWDYS